MTTDHFFAFSPFTLCPHLNARSKNVPPTTAPSAVDLFRLISLERQDWKLPPTTLPSVPDQSGLKSGLEQMCKYPWDGHERVQMALSLQYRRTKMFYYILQYIGTHPPPMYRNLSFYIGARFCILSSNAPVSVFQN